MQGEFTSPSRFCLTSKAATAKNATANSASIPMQIRYSFVLNTPPLMPEKHIVGFGVPVCREQSSHCKNASCEQFLRHENSAKKAHAKTDYVRYSSYAVVAKVKLRYYHAMLAAAMIYTKLLRQASQNFTLSVLPQIIATIINKSHMLNTKILAPRAVCLL